MQVTPADPTHEKLLAVLSQAAQLPDTEERGGATASADPPPTHPGGMAKPPTLAPASDWPPRQATSSRLPAQQCITQGNVHYRVAEDGVQEHSPDGLGPVMRHVLKRGRWTREGPGGR